MNPDELLQNKYDRLCVEYNKVVDSSFLSSYRSSVAEEQAEGIEGHTELLPKSNKKASDQSSGDTTVITHKNLDHLVADFTQALNEWSSSIRSSEKPELSDVKDALIARISRLERQLCDVSLQYQMERRRRLMVEKERSSTALDELTSASSATTTNNNHGDSETLNSVTDVNMGDSLMLDWMQERIYAVTDQAQYFAARAAFLQDELLCLIPHITELVKQALRHRAENESSHKALRQLQDDLDAAHSNALRQSTQMAEHISSLTEELQAIRAHGWHSPGSTDSSDRSAKKVHHYVASDVGNSIFNPVNETRMTKRQGEQL
ncbi:unnamed protein product [Echinostoma caproni]|uniref:Component of oligomeric Golgi complex 7 n=1 Tax=Echinostoma caproni TaxID=27848 RepID=A0A183A914_9TREM|nr:unnamed protein product [Echinostoma caproni]